MINVLTIAGLDPSSGAGLTSDLKTFDCFGLFGLSICTAITVQTDKEFKSVTWINEALILDQIVALLSRFKVNVVKIGLLKNWNTLALIVNQLKCMSPTIKIVLDPIISASAGYQFREENEQKLCPALLRHITVLTPNYEEFKQLLPNQTLEQAIRIVSRETTLYLKGGHRQDLPGHDEIYQQDKMLLAIAPGRGPIFPKHGSGCVLSAALVAGISLGQPLDRAAIVAKRFTERYLASSTGLIGRHDNVQS